MTSDELFQVEPLIHIDWLVFYISVIVGGRKIVWINFMNVTHFSEQYFVLSMYFVLNTETWHCCLQTPCRGVEFLYFLAPSVNSLLCDAINYYMELVKCSENLII